MCGASSRMRRTAPSLPPSIRWVSWWVWPQSRRRWTASRCWSGCGAWASDTPRDMRWRHPSRWPIPTVKWPCRVFRSQSDHVAERDFGPLALLGVTARSRLESEEGKPRVGLQRLPVRLDQLLHRRRAGWAGRADRHLKRGRIRLPARLHVLYYAGDVEIHQRDPQRTVGLRASPPILAHGHPGRVGRVYLATLAVRVGAAETRVSADDLPCVLHGRV